MSQREGLARRLGYVYRKTSGWQEPEVHWGDRDGEDERDQNAQRLTWLRVADECIRQMEWARKGWLERIDSNGSRFYMTAPPQSPLTLAPDDWKPE